MFLFQDQANHNWLTSVKVYSLFRTWLTGLPQVLTSGVLNLQRGVWYTTVHSLQAYLRRIAGIVGCLSPGFTDSIKPECGGYRIEAECRIRVGVGCDGHSAEAIEELLLETVRPAMTLNGLARFLNSDFHYSPPNPSAGTGFHIGVLHIPMSTISIQARACLRLSLHYSQSFVKTKRGWKHSDEETASPKKKPTVQAMYLAMLTTSAVGICFPNYTATLAKMIRYGWGAGGYCHVTAKALRAILHSVMSVCYYESSATTAVHSQPIHLPVIGDVCPVVVEDDHHSATASESGDSLAPAHDAHDALEELPVASFSVSITDKGVPFIDSDVLVSTYKAVVEEICALGQWNVETRGYAGGSGSSASECSAWGKWRLRRRDGTFASAGTHTKYETVARLLVTQPQIVGNWQSFVKVAAVGGDSDEVPVPVRYSGKQPMPFRNIDLVDLNEMVDKVVFLAGLEDVESVIARGGHIQRRTWSVKWKNMKQFVVPIVSRAVAYTRLEAAALAYNACFSRVDWRLFLELRSGLDSVSPVPCLALPTLPGLLPKRQLPPRNLKRQLELDSSGWLLTGTPFKLRVQSLPEPNFVVATTEAQLNRAIAMAAGQPSKYDVALLVTTLKSGTGFCAPLSAPVSTETMSESDGVPVVAEEDTEGTPSLGHTTDIINGPACAPIHAQNLTVEVATRWTRNGNSGRFIKRRKQAVPFGGSPCPVPALVTAQKQRVVPDSCVPLHVESVGPSESLDVDYAPDYQPTDENVDTDPQHVGVIDGKSCCGSAFLTIKCNRVC
jgi:hypothetical protein